MGILDFIFGNKQNLLKRMSGGVDAVKMGLYRHLVHQFNNQYDPEFSGRLSASVVNEVFSAIAPQEENRRFASENADLIVSKTTEIACNHQFRRIITDAIRVQMTIRYSDERSDIPLDMDPINKLKKYGILIPGGDQPTPSKFTPDAYEFLGQSPES